QRSFRSSITRCRSTSRRVSRMIIPTSLSLDSFVQEYCQRALESERYVWDEITHTVVQYGRLASYDQPVLQWTCPPPMRLPFCDKLPNLRAVMICVLVSHLIRQDDSYLIS